MTSKELNDKWHDDPNNWKLGIFYFNKEDKRLFIFKRFKLWGWTYNYANPLTYILLALLLVVLFFLR
jgi:uncharacterized membrane protein